MFLGKRPVAHVSSHPPIFATELQAPMGAYPAEYDIYIYISIDVLAIFTTSRGKLTLAQ